MNEEYPWGGVSILPLVEVSQTWAGEQPRSMQITSVSPGTSSRAHREMALSKSSEKLPCDKGLLKPSTLNPVPINTVKLNPMRPKRAEY